MTYYRLEQRCIITYFSTEIYVYYRSLKYTSITQQAKMKWEQLISNLGGYLSLFVGLSFVSLFEITEIFVEIFFRIRNA